MDDFEIENILTNMSDDDVYSSDELCAACQKVYCIECFFDDHRVRTK
jgi:hypothetical protein